VALVLEVGRTVAGRYRLDRMLGQGGMGEVWAATHAVTRRSVAMKFVKGPSHTRPELRRRFMREARAASAVQHPNVVEVFDVFELDAETPVMVMELLTGETLGRKLAREAQLDLDEAIATLLPAVSAVGSAHAFGVVHRDLKPENLFLARSSAVEGETTVKVLDFGIAKFSSAMAGETGVTETGTTLGTPCYMAPEQAMAERELDHRIDVWALGVILYETLSGARPIEGDTVGQVVKHLMTTGITPLERVVPGLPTELTALVNRMLSRERSRRPEDLREVFEVLRHLTDVRSRSFGAPGSEAPAAVELEQSSGDALVFDSAATVADPGHASIGVDTAGPHAVSSRMVRRSRSARLLGGAAASAIVGGILVYGVTRTPESATTPVGSNPASPLGAAPIATTEPSSPAIASPDARAPTSASPVAAEPSGSAPKKTPSSHRVRHAKPAGSAAASAPASSAPTRGEGATPSAVAVPSGKAAERPRSGGLAEKPPF
jgi:eukaryotic-like serine/threonine-protein kinase